MGDIQRVLVMLRSRKMMLACGVFVGAFWVGYPLWTQWDGTSESVSVTVLRQPFQESEALVYRWEGDVVRSCPADLRRKIVDSLGVETDLVARALEPLPRDELGFKSYEVIVPVPVQIAEGPAQYLVTEVPRCTWLQRLFPVGVEYPPVHFEVTR